MEAKKKKQQIPDVRLKVKTEEEIRVVGTREQQQQQGSKQREMRIHHQN